MSENLNQTFENSRKATENDLAYITRQNNAQAEQTESTAYSLESVMENINAAGIVSALAAEESMAAHKSIFQMLYAINQVQSALMDLVIDLRLNGNAGGGGTSDGISTAAAFTSLVNTQDPLVKGMLAALGFSFSKLDGSEEAKDTELSHPNSLTNKAKRAQGDAHKLIGTINYSVTPAPHPRTLGPGAFMDGDIRNALPFAGTAAEVEALMDGAREGLQAAYEARQVQEQWERMRQAAKDRGNALNENARQRMAAHATNPSTGAYKPAQAHNLQVHVAAMPPQPAQVVVQAAPPAAEPPNQTVTVHMNNNINGSFFDSRGFQDISDYLVKRIKDQLSSRGVRPSHDR